MQTVDTVDIVKERRAAVKGHKPAKLEVANKAWSKAWCWTSFRFTHHALGRVRSLSVLAVVLCWAVTLAAAPPAKLALQGGRIIPVVGKEIAKGTLLIENGKIVAVGEDVEIPYDAMVVDVSGKVLFPGLIDPHSARGLDVPNENMPVTPFLDVYDAIDPSKLYFEDALRDGITSVHVIVSNNCVIGSVSRVVHPIGLTPDDMTLDAQTAIKLSVAPKRSSDRMVQMATLRETFRELADYLDDLAEKKYEQSLEDKDEKIDVGPEEAIKRGRELIVPDDLDDKHRNLVKLTNGELTALVYCQLASDVGRAILIAKDNGFFDRMTLVLGPDCYKAAKEIKASGRPVILEPELLYRERNPVTGDIKETFVPKVYADAKIKFALLPSPNNSLAERYLNYQAARCARNGVSRRKALASITINAAKAIGLKDRIGSLTKGKVANVVVYSGDPLDFDSWVDAVYINGIRAYQRDTDVRLKELMGEKKTTADAEEKAAEEPSPADTKKSDDKTNHKTDGKTSDKTDGETTSDK